MEKPVPISKDSKSAIPKEKMDVENAVVESAWCWACTACASAACGPELALLSTCAITETGEGI